MTYKKIFAILVLALLVIGIGCTKKTGVKGRLILQTGQTGDVRGSKVQLFVSSDLTGNPVKEVGSDATGTDQTKSEFEITDVVPQYYYLLAWKDLNGNGKVDHLDIVGIHGGSYRAGYGGSQVTVTSGKTTDVGDITMLIYKELILTGRCEKEYTNGWVAFYYQFNDACEVTDWKLTYPDGTTYTDSDQNGNKVASTEYRSPVDPQYYWSGGQGLPAPLGNYIITLKANYSGYEWTLVDTLNLAK
jgi:uncharacterized protein (DUF2141 family)